MNIQIKSLSKIYGEGEAAVTALQPCSFEISGGERVAIIGASGSGKSTLLHLLGALDTPSGGSILFDGKRLPAQEEALSRFRLSNIGFVFQGYNLLPELTALENIVLPSLLRGKKKDAPYLERLIERLDLSDRLSHFPSQLSGGQQQRVAIVRALTNKPQLLLCDEPTGSLDTEHSRQVMELLEELHAEYGFTLIVVTHNPDIAERFPRILTLSDGMVGGDLT